MAPVGLLWVRSPENQTKCHCWGNVRWAMRFIFSCYVTDPLSGFPVALSTITCLFSDPCLWGQLRLMGWNPVWPLCLFCTWWRPEDGMSHVLPTLICGANRCLNRRWFASEKGTYPGSWCLGGTLLWKRVNDEGRVTLARAQTQTDGCS